MFGQQNRGTSNLTTINQTYYFVTKKGVNKAIQERLASTVEVYT